jgi:catechol 2,3-dioxygenase-like lactoylglutathione lyase family enzyme
VSDQAQPALRVVGDLDQIYYWTRDMDAAVAFFRDVVGLTLLRREGDGWAEFDAGPVHLALHRSDDPPASGTAVFRVDDLNAARRALESRGAVFDAFVGEAGGFARFATFRNPDGDPVQIIEYRH